ncbi:major tail tube protein (plasmid) [Candidatus Paracaedimonas acanthamoebae]|nr:major tail tube protein [Candidatus Paracaedimonas acanthamoebae]
MIPKTLKNFNLYIDGRGYAGRVEEINLPKLSIKTEEYRAGGMDMPVEIDMGMQKLESSITLSEYDDEVLKLFGTHDNKPNVNFRGAMEDGSGKVTPVLIALNGKWRDLDFGNWRSGDKATLKIEVIAHYYRLEIDGKELIEIDIENMVRKINGEDQLKPIRDALGI